MPASPLTGSPLSRESSTSSLPRRGCESESDADACLCCPPHDPALPVSSLNGWSSGESDLPQRGSEGDTYTEAEWRKQQDPFTEEDASCVPMEEKEKKLVGLDLRIRKPTRSENPENPERGWKDQEQLRRLGPECNYATYPAARVYSPRSAVRDVSVVPRDPLYSSTPSFSSSSFSSPSDKPGNGPAPSSATPPSCEVHGNAHPAYATFPPMSASTYGWTKTLPRMASEIRANGSAPSLSGGSSLLSTASSCALDAGSPSGSLSYPSTVSPEVSVYTSGSSGESWTFVTERESRAEQLLSSGNVMSAHVRPASAPKAGSGHSGHSDGGQAPTGRSAAPAGLDLGGGGQGPLQVLPSFSDFTLQRYLSEANHAFQAYPPPPPPPHPLPPPLLPSPSPLPFPPSSHPPPPAHNGCGPFCRPVPPPLPPLPPLPLFALPPDLKGQAILYAPLGRFLFEMLTSPGEDHEQRDGGELGLSVFKAMLVRFTSATNGQDSWRALTELGKLQSRSLGARAAPFDFRPQPQQSQQSRYARASSAVYQDSAGSLSSQPGDGGSGRGWLGESRGRCGPSEDGDPPPSARPKPGEQSGGGSGGSGGGHCQQRLGPGREEEHVVQNPAASLDAAHGELGDVHGATTTSPALLDFAFRADPSPPFSHSERSRYTSDLEHGAAGQVAPPSAHDSPAPRCAEGSAGSQNQPLQQASQQGQACQLQANQPTQQPSSDGRLSQPTQQPSSDGRQSQPIQQSAGGDTGGQTQPGRLAGEPRHASSPTQTAGSTASSRTGPGSQNQGSLPQDQGSNPQAPRTASQGQDSRSQGSWSQKPGSGLKGAGDFPYVPLKPGSSEEMAADFLLFCMAVQSALTPPVTNTTSSSSSSSGGGSAASCSAMPAFGDCPAFPDFNPSWFRFLPGFPR